MEKKSSGLTGRGKIIDFLCLSLVGLIINLLFSRIAIYFQWPLYLDNIGVVLMAMIGGYIPSIIVGYLSNIINGFGDPMTAYYATISVLIAVAASVFAKRGWFKKPAMVALSILVFSFFGGVVGSVLTWMLYGFDFGTGVTAPLVHYLYKSVIPNPFLAQLTGDFLLDLCDKTITVLMVLVIYRLIPDRILSAVDFTPWRQRPLTKQEEDTLEEKSEPLKFNSLGVKMTIMVSVAMMIIGFAISYISFRLYTESIIEDRTRMGDGVLNVVSSLVDANRVDEFMNDGHAAAGYDEVEEALINMRDSADDIEYVYVYKILEDGCHVVFDPDTEDTPGAEPGEIIGFDDAFRPYLPALLAGEEIEPVISDETYGWLLTLYKPLLDDTGKCAAYVAVDVSMADLRQTEFSFIAKVLSLFIGFFVMILTIVLVVLKYNVILPVNTMTRAAERFAFNSEENRKDSIDYIREIDIRTGDEIENLYRAFTQTTREMMQYVEDVQQKNETIARMQRRLIEVMADMVESRDKFTGDHIRKTAAYSEIILDELRKEGLYEDQLTDEFCEDVVHSAPLHDIGKIQVSDSILNKPGKLTDEEFAIMKGHTLAGSEIIARAAEAVSESGYLKEAQNLAAYHHEKWNGCGYPYGLSGEDIPLSARIMAVADVFDALVSKRSYKEGFPIEKALDIIREGKGSHFDPVIAQAFLNAEDRVREVAESHSDSERTEIDLAQAGAGQIVEKSE